MREYAEDVKIDEGTTANGVRTTLQFQGREMIVCKSFDAQPILEQCKAERLATAGERWGEMRKVGTIDPVTYTQMLTIQGAQERRKFIRDYFAKNPAFVSFEKYLIK